MPATATLRANFSDARVTLVVSNECADLLPAISGVDRVLIARRNLSDATLFLAVARERFDCCIDFTRNDRSAFLAFLSGARKRVVSYRVRDQSKTRARIYNEFVDNRMRDMHTIDYNLALLEPLGIRNVSRALHLDLPDAAREKADQLRRELVDLSGKTDLLTLTALIAQARLLVAVDSAPMHLAAAIQTPQVVLFGPTNPFHWRPRESPALILQGESRIPLTKFLPVQARLPMSQISTEAVINAMDSLLSSPATVTS